MSARLYLDHAATSPLHAAAAAVLGREPRPQATEARARLAAALALEPARVIPTQGGSQANAAALAGLWRWARARGRATVLAQRSEHPSVLEALGALEREGAQVVWLGLDAGGRIDPGEVARRLERAVGFVTLMAANHETGARQPLAEVAALARAAGVPLHSDAVQALRWAPPTALEADLLTLGGHKLGGPRGVGALLLGAPLDAEWRVELRPEAPAPERVAALAAAIEARPLAPDRGVASSRDTLQAELLARIPGLAVNGPLGGGERLEGHLSLSIAGLSGEALVLDLDQAGIALSSGAACASGTSGPSPVLLAIGRSEAEARGSLRLTLGRALAPEERARVVDALAASVTRLRKLAGEG